MLPQEDMIVDISPAREKYFGCSGKMLLPCSATVEAMLEKIPAKQLITTDLLRQQLADQFAVEACCPVTTGQVLQAIAKHSDKNVAYWRVIKQSGELFAKFPGGVEGHADLLRREGFSIESQGKTLKVKDFKASLVHFA